MNTADTLVSFVALGSLLFVFLVFYVIALIILFIIKVITKKKITGRQIGTAIIIPIVFTIIYAVFTISSTGGR